MNLPLSTRLKQSLRRTLLAVQSIPMRVGHLLSGKAYPVECNICGWQGEEFKSDLWHRGAICPQCQGALRYRLLYATLAEENRLEDWIQGKRMLHFAPEAILSKLFAPLAGHYDRADFLRSDCNLRLDMCQMTEVADQSYDAILHMDVLEHVPDLPKALDELYRILAPGGIMICTIPQKDGLAETQEDPSIDSPEARLEHYGQEDHLRIFGDDFAGLVQGHGFEVEVIDQQKFSPDRVQLHGLKPPEPSVHPLATNHRRIYLCSRKA